MRNVSALKVSSDYQDNIWNKKRQEKNNTSFIIFLSDFSSSPSSIQPLDTGGKSHNTKKLNEVPLNPSNSHSLQLPWGLPEEATAILSICLPLTPSFSFFSRWADFRKPRPREFKKPKWFGFSLSGFVYSPLFLCSHTAQQVTKSNYKNCLTDIPGRKFILISQLLTQLPSVFIKPRLFLQEFAKDCHFFILGKDWQICSS